MRLIGLRSAPGALLCVMFVISTSLHFAPKVFAAEGGSSQSDSRPFDMTVGQLIQAKLSGTTPDYERLTTGIVNGAERARRIADLKATFQQLDLSATFRTKPYAATFRSNTLKGLLITSWNNSSLLPIELTRLNFNVAGIAFLNADEIATVPLASIPPGDAKAKEMRTRDIYLPGAMVFEFRIVGLDHARSKPLFPMVHAPAEGLASRRIMAFLTKVEFYEGLEERKIFEEHFDPPAPAQAPPPPPAYPTELALHGHAKDFDIRGLSLAMSVAEVKEYAANHHMPMWTVPGIDDMFYLPEGACAYAGGTNRMPTANQIGASCIAIWHVGDVVTHISYDFRSDQPVDRLADAILRKYGMPLTQRDGVYYWGDELSPGKGDHVFAVSIATFPAVTPPGTYVSIEAKLPNPPEKPAAAFKL